MHTLHARPPADALLLDDTNALLSVTADWANELRATGLNVDVLEWRSRPHWKHRPVVTEKVFTRLKAAVVDAGRPVAIGRGDGAATVYRLLAADAVRAAVLIGTTDIPPAVMKTHAPILLMDDDRTPEPQVDALREAGICDQQTVDDGFDALLENERIECVAQYIHDWLSFHQLLTR